MRTSPARIDLDSDAALAHARTLGHRFTELPARRQMAGDLRLSWRCLDCGAHVITHHAGSASNGFLSDGSEGVALSRSCESLRNV
jgi:hypothetical protein